MSRLGILGGLTCLCLALATARAETIWVPDDHASIQAAIAAAAHGDTIVVRPGTYGENIDFLGKALIVTSEQGPELTVIDGGRSGSTISFVSGEGPDSVLKGFTITNGYALDGGGIFCHGADPLIADNVVDRNEAVRNGGGIYCWSAEPRITANTISRNIAAGDGGGTAAAGGSDVLFTNNIVVKNTTGGLGGGIAGISAACRIVNNTLKGNSAASGGGAYGGSEAASAEIVNTILWDDHGSEGAEIRLRSAAAAAVSHCDVMGGQSSTAGEAGCFLDWDEASIFSTDPRFEDGKKEFHIDWRSRCRDTGTGHPGLPAVDFEGDPRIAGNEPDIGADEFYLGEIILPCIDVTCNGEDKDVVVQNGENVKLTISILAGDFKGMEADVWVIGLDASGSKWSMSLNPLGGRCYYELWRGWCHAYITGSLYNLVDNVLDRPLQPGHYTVCLGIDLKPNGKLNTPCLWDHDIVEFDVVE